MLITVAGLLSHEYLGGCPCRALKTVLGESCDAIAQAQAMSYLNLAWGLGTILGPVIGGYFAYPCDGLLNPHGPLCTNDSWLQTR